MRPYLYILGVLTIGAGLGFYLGQKTASVLPVSREIAYDSDDRERIKQIFRRQQEAYNLHDGPLLFRDCSNSYVEINAETGESYNLAKAIVYSNEILKRDKSIAFTLMNPEITIIESSAVVRAKYSKASDRYEDDGEGGLVGQGTWLLCKSAGRWEIAAFSWNRR